MRTSKSSKSFKSALATLLAFSFVTTLVTGVLAPDASAQLHGHATLYARADGDDVKAVVEIRLDPGFHIYHGPTAADLGPPDAVGTPTTFEFSGAEVTWSAPRFPEPERETQDFGDTKTWILEHSGSPRIWFRGKAAKGADLAKLTVKIDGLTCDAGGCVPYSETVKSTGAGTDKLFAKFPADLTVAAVVADAPQDAKSPPAPTAAGVPTFQGFGGKLHAHATLYARADGSDVKVAVQIAIDPGFHLYQGPTKKEMGSSGAIGTPTTIELLGSGFSWGAPRFPEPVRETQEFGTQKEFIFEHVGTIVVWLRGKANGGDVAKLSAKLAGDTCDANGCVPYAETVTTSGRGDDALFAKFPSDLAASAVGATATSPDAAASDDDVANIPMWKFLALAVGWAVFSLLMPCTYPMIPITISFFTKQAANRQTSTFSLSFVYGLGIFLSFVAIGVVVGPPIARFAANPWTNLVIGGVFIAFALSLLGLFILQPPQFLMGFATSATQKGGYLGVFLMGLTLCVTSFTCTAPFVGSLLAVGAKGGGMFRVVVGMGVFGLVMAVPFVFLSMLPARAKALPKSGEWAHSLKVTLGFIELAAAVKFISNCDLVWKWNALPREIVLGLWSAILMVAAFYVWGVITLKEDVEIRGEGATPGIGPRRLVIGLALFLLAMYLLLGAFGARLDSTTETLAPNYSKPFFTAAAGPGSRASEVVAIMDDWDAALAKARSEHKLIAVNFTGDV